MFRSTILAALLALLATAAVMTGCDSGKGGTERKTITGPPPSDAQKTAPAIEFGGPKDGK